MNTNKKIIQGLGMPYMGSKRKIAHRIINKILEDTPKIDNFYDCFGGGGAISFNALQRRSVKQVHYNEFSSGVVELLKDIQKNGVSDKYFEFISRDTFFNNLDKGDWFSGLCSVVYSFGNNGRDYIFGKNVEPTKHLAHDMLISQSKEKLEELSELLGIKIPQSIINCGLFGFDLHKQRKELAIFVTKNKDRFELEQLQRLQQLQQLERLQITNESYENVKISDNGISVLYLDPPYKYTAKYKNDIDHDKLRDFIHNSKHKIYLSSYENVYDMQLVDEIEHSSSISAVSVKKVTERLFTNKAKA